MTINQNPTRNKRLAMTAAALAAAVGLGVAAVGAGATTNPTDLFTETPNAEQGPETNEGTGGESNESPGAREGTSGESSESASSREGPESSEAGGVESSEGARGEGARGEGARGKASEAAGHEGNGSEGTSGSGEPGESGTQYSINQTFDETQSGARLIMNYDPRTNAFIGTVENTTNNVLNQVRVEVHLSNGTEIGPTTPVDLAPGQVIDVNLLATSAPFTGYSAHPKSGDAKNEFNTETRGLA